MAIMGVSVIVITKNEEDNIRECLSSILSNSYENFELIVVDSSTDDTAMVVNGMSDKKIRYFYSERGGFSIQRNIGLREAKHNIVVFTDADCVVPSDWLGTLLSAYKGDIAGVGGNAYPLSGSPWFGRCVACLGFPGGGSIGLEANFEEKRGVQIATCNALFLRKALLDVGGFGEGLSYGGEDTAICRELKESGYKVIYEPKSFVWHRTRNTMGQFISWCIRRGKARSQLQPVSLIQVLFDPSSPAGTLFLIIIIAIVASNWLLTGIITLLFLYLVFVIGLYSLSRKYNLLLKRKKSIEVGFLSLIFVVPILLYGRRMIMSSAEIIARWERTTT